MRKVAIAMVVVLLLLACTGVQERWNALTPDQKARIILNDMQTQLDNLFETGRAYVATRPEHQTEWRDKIVPMFSVANQALRTMIALSIEEEITPDKVYVEIQPLLNSIIEALVAIGAVR